MSKVDLKKARASAEYTYYESIARLIVDNPTVTLAALRTAHGITQYDMRKAKKMFHVRRRTGRGSAAYPSIKQ